MVPPRRAGRGDDGKVPAEFEELVKPHVASFDYFLGEGLQTLVLAVKPVVVRALPGPYLLKRPWWSASSSDHRAPPPPAR